MAFDPDAYLETEDFNPDDYLAGNDVAANIAKLGGVKQADGTYLVPGEGGTAPFRLDAEGNRLGETPAIGADVEASGLEKVVATTAAGAQGFIPQIAGAARVVATAGSGVDARNEYRKTRDETKRTIEQARAKSGLGYDVLGSVLSGGLVAPATVGGRIGVSALLGAANAASGSTVDTTDENADLEAFAKDVATGAAIGTAAGVVGEGVGAGIRKLGGLVTGNAAKAIATQTAKDAAAVEKEIASLAGKVGAETQKGSRFAENIQRGVEGLDDIPGARELAEGVLASNRASLPGQLATIDAAKVAHAAAVEAGPGKAAQMTRDYFAAPLFQKEILPRLKNTIAPRFGLAAVGVVMAKMGGAASAGAGIDKLFGGDGSAGGFAGAVLGAPGMMQMLRNVAKSPRVQVAVAERLAPMLQHAANSVARVAAPTAALLAQYTLTEAALGPSELVAQQLVAAGGLASMLGDNGTTDPAITAANAPRSELDKAIQTTTGVTLLAGALEQHHEAVARGLDALFTGKPLAQKHARLPPLGAMGVDPQSMLDRLAANTGNLAEVAPGVAAELAATAQRAVDYLAKVGSQPPLAGPLAPKWTPSAAEQRSLRLAQGIVASPMSILDAAAAGMLVPEQVAALNAVYPMLGRSIQDAALSRLEAGVKVSYRARLMLGFLTDTDIDGTLASIGPNQVAIHAQSQKPSNAGTPAGAEQLTVASRTSAHQSEEA